MVGFEGVKKGSWSREEDALLKKCVETHGEGRWHEVPLRAGLNRCRKSCRLRWLNYLKPNIKKGAFAADEVDLMLRLHNLLGNRWSLIAGRLPGRTANDVKNYWKTHTNKKFGSNLAKVKHKIWKTLIKPKAMKPRSAQTCQTGEPRCSPENAGFTENVQAKESNMNNSTLQAFGNDAMWWDSVLNHQYGIRGGTCCAGGSEQVPKTNLLLEGISPAAADAGKSAAEEGRNGWSDVSFETDLRDIFKTIL